MSRPLGVLRPEPGNAATAGRIAALGHAALRLPLFAVVPLAWEPPDPAPFAGLLLTSANAVRQAGPGLARYAALPAWTVGAATAAAARAAGLDVVATGEGGVAALLGRADVPPRAALLHLAGRDHAGDGGPAAIVYAADPLAPDLAPLAGAVALVHSPRAGARLAELAARQGIGRAAIAVAAISPAALATAGAGWRATAVAARPRDAPLIAAAVALAD